VAGARKVDESKRLKRILFPVAAVVLSAAAAILVLELLLRAWYLVHHRYDPPKWYISEDWGWRPTPDLSVVYTKAGYGEIVFSSTREGFRRYGEPKTSKTKVLAVGDSTTQAYQVSDGQTYYDVLADHDPDLEVFAFGVGGYGTVQEALAIERYRGEISPDVVVWQFSGNDLILESLSPESNNHMRRPYLEDGRIVHRHPDGRLGWLAERSLVARRLVVLRSSLLKRLSGTIESELHFDHPGLQRSLATMRRAIQQVIEAAPDVVFFAFFVPSHERYSYDYEFEVFAELCRISRLRCLPDVHEAVAAASLSGKQIDSGDYDAHWNGAGHAIAGRVILDHLRREMPAQYPAQPR
jgi:hypothetical protein